MIRIKMKHLLNEKEFSERRKITLDEISQKTGISKATLSRVASVIGYNTNTKTLNLLCQYFECDLTDLCEYIDDRK